MVQQISLLLHYSKAAIIANPVFVDAPTSLNPFLLWEAESQSEKQAMKAVQCWNAKELYEEFSAQNFPPFWAFFFVSLLLRSCSAYIKMLKTVDEEEIRKEIVGVLRRITFMLFLSTHKDENVCFGSANWAEARRNTTSKAATRLTI